MGGYIEEDRTSGNQKSGIPKEIVYFIKQDLHNLYGHPGCRKTIKLIQEYFTFDQ